MGKAILAIVACFIALVMPLAMVNAISIESTDLWLHQLANAKEKVTYLHFYLHDIYSGPNPTAMVVAKSNMTDKSPTLFGGISMTDDPLTEGPEPTSKEVGRAQGLYGSADQKNWALIMCTTVVFTSGDFNGSTLAILGRNPALENPRELPVIGGTGAFRLARGFAAMKTHFYNATNGDAIVQYNVTVIHY